MQNYYLVYLGLSQMFTQYFLFVQLSELFFFSA